MKLSIKSNELSLVLKRSHLIEQLAKQLEIPQDQFIKVAVERLHEQINLTNN